MRVLYAHKSHPIEPLGVGYLASSIARGGHETKLLLTSRNLDEAEAHVNREIEQYKPGIFAQSIIFGSHGYAIELNRRIKQRHPNIVGFLGGPAPTFTPELIDRGFDAICRYEGEIPFLQFCNALEAGEDVGNIPNIWVRQNPDLFKTEVKTIKLNQDVNDPNYLDDSGFDPQRGRFVNANGNLLEGDDLDALPLPDRDVLYEHAMYRDSPIKHFYSTRGCAFHCSYCHIHVQNAENKGKGSPVRRRSNESVAQEISEVMKKHGGQLAYHQDDILGAAYSVDHAKAYADVMEPLQIPQHAHVRFDLIARHPDIAKHLARGGITGVHVAIEAGDDFIRNTVHRREMSIDEIMIGARNLRDNGIKMMTQNILGAPGETREQMIKTLELNIAVQPTFASASIFQPYPGVSALEYARDTGELPVQNQNELIDMFGFETFYNRSILIKDPAHKRWLERFQKFFAIAVANPQMHSSGVLERIMGSYPEGEDAERDLEHMYREHRAQSDEELYGVKLTDVVMEEN